MIQLLRYFFIFKDISVYDSPHNDRKTSVCVFVRACACLR